MDENKITFKKILKERINDTNEQKIRVNAYLDQKNNDEWFFSWMYDLYNEINFLYTALELLHRQNEGMFKLILGLDSGASLGKIGETAREYGTFSQELIKKGREMEEERKEKEKHR